MDMPKQEEVPGSKYKIGPFELKENKIKIAKSKDGKLVEIKFDKAHKFADWLSSHGDKLDEFQAEPEKFLFMFLKQHFEAMGDEGAEQAAQLKEVMDIEFESSEQTAMQHMWEKGKFNLAKIYQESDIEMPEEKSAERIAA